MPSLLSKRLDTIESVVMAKASGTSTPVGIYRPGEDGPVHIKTVKRVDGEWVDTDEPHRATLSEAMLPALVSRKRFVVIIGGRGSGKSQGEAEIVVIDMHDNAAKTGCFREFQNSIEDSVYSLLEGQIAKCGLTGFTMINTAIRAANGAEAKFRGLARNPDSVKSMDGFKRFWVEEAQASSDKSLKLLTPTMRQDGGQIVFTANPGSSEDPFSKRFITPFKSELDAKGIYEDELHTVLKVNWRDNPWFPEDLNRERLWDYENLPRALYDHIWEGEFNDSVENGLIMAEWFDACIDAHLKLGFEPRGIKKLSHDPSDIGGDPKAIAYRHGNVFIEIDEKTEGDVNEGADWATGMALNLNCDEFVWDVGGLGLGLKRDISLALDGKRIRASMFNGAESPDNPMGIYQPVIGFDVQNQKTNKDVFRNKRAQRYAMLRDKVYRTFRAVVHGEMADPSELISFSSKAKCLSKLRSEMCRLPIKPNGQGLFEMYTKEQMRSKFKFASPNLTDSVMMCIGESHVAQYSKVIPPPLKTYRMR